MSLSQARTARQTEATATPDDPATAPARATRSGSDSPTAGSEAPTAKAGTARRRSRTTRHPPPPPPRVLDRYRLHHRLGSGAFGTVWMADDERLEREVAVKMLPRERIMDKRFEREARVAARLSHPGIVTLYEASVDDDGAYLVSELVRGVTLGDLLQAGRLSDRDIVAIGLVLCDALEHAHAQDVVHRDVKPSNILVPDQPASPAQLAKLTDFGVARVVGGDSLTRTGDVIGTLAYMAPEQAEGLVVGPEADLYSLALVLYEALTGVNPAATPTGAVRPRRLGTYLPPLRRQRRDLPRELGQAIDMALRPRPRERGRIVDLRRALTATRDQVGDNAGVVADPWPTETLARRPATEALAAAEQWREDPSPAGETGDASDDREAPAESMAWPPRAVAALGAAGTAAWLSAHVLAPAPVPPAVLALIAAALVLLTPRWGWLALTAAAVATATAQAHAGSALLIMIALLAGAVLIPWRATAWPQPAGAVALGLIGLAGAWPALAGRATGVWRRAALGAAGWVWLLLAAPFTRRALYLQGQPTRPVRAWAGSITDTVGLGLTPLIHSGVLAAAVVWALAAAVLPWLVRGRSLTADIVLVVIWSATLVSAQTAVIAAVHGPGSVPTAPAAVLGAVAGGLVALAPVWVATQAGWAAPWRRARTISGA